MAEASWVRSPENVTSSRSPFSTEYVATAARSRSFIRFTTKSRAARLALTIPLGEPKVRSKRMQEVASRRGVDRRVLGRGRHDGSPLVEDLEARDGLLLAVVVDFEVFGLQVLDGPPVLVRDVDGDLDQRDARLFPHGRLLRLLLRLVGAGRETEIKTSRQNERERPGPAAHAAIFPPGRPPRKTAGLLTIAVRRPSTGRLVERSRAAGKARRTSPRSRAALSRSPRIS